MAGPLSRAGGAGVCGCFGSGSGRADPVSALMLPRLGVGRCTLLAWRLFALRGRAGKPHERNGNDAEKEDPPESNDHVSGQRPTSTRELQPHRTRSTPARGIAIGYPAPQRCPRERRPAARRPSGARRSRAIPPAGARGFGGPSVVARKTDGVDGKPDSGCGAACRNCTRRPRFAITRMTHRVAFPRRRGAAGAAEALRQSGPEGPARPERVLKDSAAGPSGPASVNLGFSRTLAMRKPTMRACRSRSSWRSCGAWPRRRWRRASVCAG